MKHCVSGDTFLFRFLILNPVMGGGRERGEATPKSLIGAQKGSHTEEIEICESPTQPPDWFCPHIFSVCLRNQKR